ncbi:hypothetical protein GCM10009665_37370 [Kitasatospora nipponensis]|uniref:Metalloprotease TldD/E C-terminal domain-containing protein n=1 Tax=Kitasatospora nipponensis TaxID=258049 RepID=A0ABN1WEA8_9ACTN
MTPGTADLERLARDVLAACADGAGPVQVFAEETVALRVRCAQGERVETVLESTAGVGVATGTGAERRYAFAPLDRLDALLPAGRPVPALPGAGRGADPGTDPSVDPGADPGADLERWALLTAGAEAWRQDPELRRAGGRIWSDEEFSRSRRAVVDSDGTAGGAVRERVRKRCWYRQDGDGRDGVGRVTGASRWSGGPGGSAGPDALDPAERADRLARAAYAQARALAAARPHPAATTPVVLAAGVSGAFLHELVGHALEADHLGRPGAAFVAQPGRRIATAALTVLDDPNPPQGHGSLSVDDEGRPAPVLRLVEEGRVVGRIGSGAHPSPFGDHAAGRGRRQSYRFPALPRACNTVVLPGRTPAAELLEPGVLLVRALGGGEVDLRGGEFTFVATEAYRVGPRGELDPVRDVHLAGSVTATLDRLVAVGDDPAWDNISCGKQGQWLGIGLHAPSLRFEDLRWEST